MKVNIDNKYEWIFDEINATLKCKRYGKEWRDETGDGAIYSLLAECDRLQNENNKKINYIKPVVKNSNRNCILENLSNGWNMEVDGYSFKIGGTEEADYFRKIYIKFGYSITTIIDGQPKTIYPK